MIDQREDSFDWVSARRNSFPDCSLPMLFQILVEIAEMNVKQANAKAANPDVIFRHKPLGDRLVVGRDRALNGGVETQTVVFELLEKEIRVSKRPGTGQPKKFLFSVKPSIAEDEECAVEVDGETMRLWQVTKKALGPLFFMP
jgi:hypothetical protein